MLKNRIKIVIFMVMAGAMALNACKKEEDKTINVKPDNRVFIVNEGPFMTGSGSLDVYYRDTEELVNDAFKKVNGFELGNLVQSVAVHNNKVYIVVNNANRIEVASKEELVSLGTIENINLPRYFLGIDAGKGYVSSWDNKVYVIDLDKLEISGEIPASTGPEKMIMLEQQVWVLNQGGLSYDSVVTIIDIKTDEVLKNLVVGDKPSGIVVDDNGKVWVLCSGNGWNGFPGPGDSRGKLVCIDPSDFSILKDLEFPGTENHPEKLVIDNSGTQVYFNYPGGLYSQDLSKQSLEMNIVLSSQTMFYGLGYDPVSELLFVSDPLDYVQKGKVLIVDPVGEEILKTITAGVIPGEFFFN